MYIKMKYGFVYLVSLIDISSRRKLMGCALSKTLVRESYLSAFKNVLKSHKPKTINSATKGCQFINNLEADFLVQCGIKISMDGKGHCFDNIYIERFWRTYNESVFLHCYETLEQARKILTEFFDYYNKEKPHQWHNYYQLNAILDLGKIPSQVLLEQFRRAKLGEVALI